MRILAVEDDVTSQLMLKSMLSEHDVTIADSGEAGVEAASEVPDLVIMDIELPGIDGYETCRRLRGMDQTKNVPIIFVSRFTALEDRLLAYGAGGNDYISKPFDAAELQSKIDSYGKIIERQHKISQELQDSHRLVMELQTSAANVGSIGRFTQATLFCHDTDTLLRHFFKTAHEIGLSCVLRVTCAGEVDLRSSDDSASTLEREILELSSAVERIHSFGNGRAIYRWGRATMLVRQIGQLIDTAAVFMDALEAGLKLVDTEQRLLQQIEALDSSNVKAQKRVAELFGMMNGDLKDAILSLGLVAALDIEDEDRLTDLLDRFSEKIKAELQALAENNKIIPQVIAELRTPPPELKKLMDITEDDDDDDFVLF